MSDNTLNYSFILPEVDGSDDQWGDMLNQNWSDLDTLLKAQEDATGGLQGGVNTLQGDVNTLQGDVNTLQGRTLTAGNGLTGGGDLSSDQAFALGTPSTLSGSTSNGVSGSSHTHAIDSTVSRTDSSASTLLAAAAMNSHRTSGDHDSRYARLSGGADANFTEMPTVGGDPVVESGSNSDGEWTRWADGTQAVTGNVLVPGGSGSVSSQSFSWPRPFTDISNANPCSVCSMSTSVPGSVAEVCALSGEGNSGATAYVLRTNSTSTRVSFYALSRWK